MKRSTKFFVAFVGCLFAFGTLVHLNIPAFASVFGILSFVNVAAALMFLFIEIDG